MTRLALCFMFLAGCAGATAPQQTPASTRTSQAAEGKAAAPDDRDRAEPAAEAPTAEPSSAPSEVTNDTSGAAENDGIRSASRPPVELITAPNVLFVFNFSASEVGAAARERCEGESSDPPELRACMEKERGKVPVESIRFLKDQSGSWWWLTYNRYKGSLLKWHKVQFSPGEQTTDSISLNLIGKDKGIAPMARVPRSLAIALPNDYSIVVKDAEFGAMTYDAKIGLMESAQP